MTLDDLVFFFFFSFLQEIHPSPVRVLGVGNPPRLPCSLFPYTYASQLAEVSVFLLEGLFNPLSVSPLRSHRIVVLFFFILRVTFRNPGPPPWFFFFNIFASIQFVISFANLSPGPPPKPVPPICPLFMIYRRPFQRANGQVVPPRCVCHLFFHFISNRFSSKGSANLLPFPCLEMWRKLSNGFFFWLEFSSFPSPSLFYRKSMRGFSSPHHVPGH